MVKLFTVFLIAILSIGISQTAFADDSNAPHKIALLIGVMGYDKLNNWETLNTDNDVEIIKSVLVKEPYSFKEKDIKVLNSYESTTREQILKNFKEWLIDKSKPGDIIYFHYSGHGSTIPNPNKLSGFDGTLVPSDAKASNILDNNQIRGPELDRLIKQLKGRHVFMAFDCCHSGGNTRGLKVRGKPWSGPMPPKVTHTSRGKNDSETPIVTSETEGRNDVTVLSACHWDKDALEVDPSDSPKIVGRLTFALAAALEQQKAENYGDLRDKVRSIMVMHNWEQIPEMDGKLNTKIFGTEPVYTDRYFPVACDKSGNLNMQAGMLHGLTEGSLMSLYPAGTKNYESTKPFAKATIDKLGIESSTLKLTDESKNASVNQLSDSRAVLEEIGFDSNRITVSYTNFDKSVHGLQIKEKLQKNPFINKTIVSNKVSDLDINYDKSKFTMTRREGIQAVDPVADDDNAASSINEMVRSFALRKFVLSMSNQGAIGAPKVEFEVYKADYKKDSNGELIVENGKPVLENGEKSLHLIKHAIGKDPELYINNYLFIRIANKSKVPVYINILDITEQGVAVMVPNNISTMNFTTIANDGIFHDLPTPFEIVEPIGSEIFKIIVTTVPVDLSILDSTVVGSGARGKASRKESSAFEQLLLDYCNGQSTSRSQSQKISAWQSLNFNFEVLPKDAR